MEKTSVKFIIYEWHIAGSQGKCFITYIYIYIYIYVKHASNFW